MGAGWANNVGVNALVGKSRLNYKPAAATAPAAKRPFGLPTSDRQAIGRCIGAEGRQKCRPRCRFRPLTILWCGHRLTLRSSLTPGFVASRLRRNKGIIP